MEHVWSSIPESLVEIGFIGFLVWGICILSSFLAGAGQARRRFAVAAGYDEATAAARGDEADEATLHQGMIVRLRLLAHRAHTLAGQLSKVPHLTRADVVFLRETQTLLAQYCARLINKRALEEEMITRIWENDAAITRICENQAIDQELKKKIAQWNVDFAEFVRDAILVFGDL